MQDPNLIDRVLGFRPIDQLRTWIVGLGAAGVQYGWLVSEYMLLG